MDPLNAMRQQFTETFRREPNETELADMFLAAGIMMHAASVLPSQILSRVQQMITPGTPLNTFLRYFK